MVAHHVGLVSERVRRGRLTGHAVNTTREVP
mgnify:CR=1 FL=1